MLISDSKQFIFIHVSKVAGSSIRGALEPYALKNPGKVFSLLRFMNLPSDYRKFRFRTHTRLDFAQKKLPKEIYQQYLKFAFVRNPWDRLVSGYYAYYTNKPGKKDKPFMTFMQYLKLQKRRKNFQLCRIVNCDNKIDLNFMGRFEQLEDDCNELGKLLDINIALPHINKSAKRKKDFRTYYDEQAYNFVNDNWAKDIEVLNYKFD